MNVQLRGGLHNCSPGLYLWVKGPTPRPNSDTTVDKPINRKNQACWLLSTWVVGTWTTGGLYRTIVQIIHSFKRGDEEEAIQLLGEHEKLLTMIPIIR